MIICCRHISGLLVEIHFLASLQIGEERLNICPVHSGLNLQCRSMKWRVWHRFARGAADDCRGQKHAKRFNAAVHVSLNEPNSATRRVTVNQPVTKADN